MIGKYRSLEPLICWRDLRVEENTVDWSRLFARPDQPLVLEIGFGNGEYLTRQSTARRDVNFIGLELHWGSIRRCLRRLHQAHSDNVRVLQVDAAMALRFFLNRPILSEFVALFPCPWPKRVHRQHRLFSHGFMAALRRALRDDGKGMIVTDDAPFRDFILSESKGSGFSFHCQHVPARYNTKYERRWQSEGQQEFYEIHFKPTDPVVSAPQQEVQLIARQVERIPEGGPRPENSREPVCVEFKKRIYDAEQQVYMFLVVAAEEGLTQTFWIEVQHWSPDQTQSGKGRWGIRPAPGSGVFPTVGVQRALDLVYAACRVEGSGEPA